METFAERLRTFRELKGLTQAGLADVIGVAMNTVSLWEHGKRGEPKDDKTRYAIVEALGVT